MKKNDIILGSSVIVYSFLFFQQTAGINFLLFTLMLTAFLVIKDFTILFHKEWIVTAIGSMLSACCIVYTNSLLAIISNIISLSLMAGYSMNKNSSLIFSGLYSLYSYLSAVPFMFIDLAQNRKNRQTEDKIYVKFFIILVPLIIATIFFFMYRGASPAFNEFAEKINIDFLTWELVRFTISGFILLYGFFYHRKISYLFHKDMLSSDQLTIAEADPKSLLLKFLSEANENLSGVVLLALLNILLMVVNIVDVNYIYMMEIPKELSYSQFVHQGTGMLITSIVSAILIILYYFRGTQNFYEKNGTLKFLVYLWILQNLILILSTAARNQMYIGEYGLTYKRIGVYVYLLLSFIGLVTTLIKIITVKSNWFLFRKNAWAAYIVLVLSCLINWDMFITVYNIEYSKRIDREYLMELTPASLPYLWKYSDQLYNSNVNKVITQTKEFQLEWENANWQSWSYEKYRIYSALEKFKEEPTKIGVTKISKEEL
jgi:hypothetical protein